MKRVSQRTDSTRIKRQDPIRLLTVVGTAVVMVAAGLQAGDVIKAGTGTDLTVGASWGGTAPTSGDVAVWTNTSLRQGLTLPSDVTWKSIVVTNMPTGGAIDITGPGKISLSSGITLYANAVDMTLATPVANTLLSSYWVVGAGRTLTVSGDISGTTWVRKNTGLNSGTLVLSGANTFTGQVNATLGTVKAASTNAFGHASNTVYLGGGATVILATTASMAPYPFNKNAAVGDVASILTLDPGISTPGFTHTLGTITAGATGFYKWNFTSANFSSTPTVSFASLDGGPTTKAWEATLNPVGVNVSIGGVKPAVQGSGGPRLCTLILDGTSTGNQVTGAIQDNGTGLTLTYVGVTKQGSGTWTLSGTNTYSGATTVTAGTLQIGNGGSSGTLGSGPVTNNATLVFNNSETVTVTSSIVGTGTVTQAGAGALVLAGANTYTGGTTVSNGTLLVNGSITGAVTVAMGGTLGGTGTVYSATTVDADGILSPGGTTNSAGTLTFGGDVTLASGTLYNVNHINAVSDTVVVGGTLTLPATLAINLSIVGEPLPKRITLFTAGSLAGATDLSGWQVSGVSPPKYRIVREGTKVVAALPLGTLFMFQ